MKLLEFASHQLRRAAEIVDRIEKLKGELSVVLGDSSPSSPKVKGKNKTRKMSEAGRLAIIAAQKARWAKAKAKVILKPLVAKTAKRKMSPAARAKIAASAKARWAKAKAAGKKAL
jgi:hypothetical protein